MPRESWTRDVLSSPIGEILLVTDREGRLRALDFEDYEARMLRLLRTQSPGIWLGSGHAPEELRRSIGAYFEGDLHALHSVRWTTGGTHFQRQVWQALGQIPVGATWTYAEVASSIGRPSAMRAVGMANGSNPIAVVVPCHRVIGRDGTLTGYGGGLGRKQWLLRHEGCSVERRPALTSSRSWISLEAAVTLQRSYHGGAPEVVPCRCR